MELIADDIEYEKIKKIGKSLKSSYNQIKDEIGKYMEMEDHELISELNLSLNLISDAQNVYDSWKTRSNQYTTSNSYLYPMPPTCMFLIDLIPKENPEIDELSDSIQEMQITEPSKDCLPTERDMDFDKEPAFSLELTGLGADYCRLKDKLDTVEQNQNMYKNELEILQMKFIEKLEENEKLCNILERYKETENYNKKNEEELYKLMQVNDSYKEKCENLEELLKETENKLNLALKDATEKQEIIENLGIANTALCNSCKNLELEVEKYIESEKYLRKEIKELFKRVEKRKPERDNSSISSNSELTLQNNESSIKDQRISLIPLMPLSIDDKENSNSAEIFDSLETDQNSHTSLFETCHEGYSQSHIRTETLSHIENLSFLRECMKKRHGVIFEDEKLVISISLSVEENSGKGKLSFQNKSQFDLQRIKTKLFADPLNGLSIAISSEFIESLPRGNTVYKHLIFECLSIFQAFPYLKISYFIEESKYENIIVLPIAYTLFCKKSNIDFIME